MNLVLRNRDGFPIPFSLRPAAFDRPIERLIDSMFEDFLAPASAQDALVSAPRINVAETDNAYEVEAELPGAAKEDVKIAIDKQRVSIEAEVKRDSERKEGETVIHAERVVRKFVRSFTLATEVDDTRAAAKLENGVLKLTLPKKERAQPRQITIQ
ncbi:MAG TPA: Hsp20/alpha crystallin family protein [Burkholderiaceae bacterium]|jgi:HSP20 family protein|nr:Hsp20/alpha crystallin family protein [Burkholderiaceae bacterium]